MDIVVDFADCDPARIVFYPRYFEWFDRATERMFRARGMPWAQMFPEYRMAGVALVDASASFRGPSRFGDQISSRAGSANGAARFSWSSIASTTR